LILRENQLNTIQNSKDWDFIIIGGGASGLGAAVDAVSRGYKTVLFEYNDFAKGTSSRSTKLVHGGVRYLAQGNIALVKEALEERGLLAKNARHLFKNQKFVIPSYKWWQRWYYSIGLTVYDLLAGRLGIGKTKSYGKKKTLKRLPTLVKEKLSGGVVYHDGQFDDSRLALNLAQTAINLGATVLNHMKVIDLIKDDTGKLKGVVAQDQETKQKYPVYGKVVLNATGVFTNKITKLDGRKKDDWKVVPSQGVHLVLDQAFLESDDALMIPKTSDGRVLFAVPWHGKVVVGTTDMPVKKSRYEPLASEEEIEFILSNANKYLSKKPTRNDVLSVFAGLRPLVAPEGDKQNTKEISRGHRIIVSDSGLLSIVGGKWTTYRHMAEELVNKAIETHQLEFMPCNTRSLSIHGNIEYDPDMSSHWYVYGSELENVVEFIGQNTTYGEKIHPNYEYRMGEIIWAVRNEMARTVEDVLARRIRLLFLDAQAAIDIASKVVKVLGEELQKDDEWIQTQEKEFINLAKNYLITPSKS
jgi:glycerol-3-phosphate dehydrogenase